MTKPTLFICVSCNRDSYKGESSQGTCLLERLRSLQPEEMPFAIQPVDCLWMCDRACVVAVSASDRPTYLFTNLLPTESAEALLQFAELYHQNSGNSIRYNQLPEVLQSAGIAKIPPVQQACDTCLTATDH